MQLHIKEFKHGYRTGKINVVSNGTSVAGVGTQWADAKNGVMPGTILLAPDNQLYEIKSVSNNNLFVLSSPLCRLDGHWARLRGYHYL